MAMKKIIALSVFAAALLAASCSKEFAGTTPETGAGDELTAAFGDVTKTGFDEGVYKWKKDDAFLARSKNAAGSTEYVYSGTDAVTVATFTSQSTGDMVYTGTGSFALYPATASGSYPCVEGGVVKAVLKDTYTWSDGNAEAPMMANVEEGSTLAFKQLGGLLKITYKYIPPKAVKLLVSAPVDASNSYQLSGVFAVEGTTEPYVQSASVSGSSVLTQDFTAAQAAQKASDDGVTFYVPLPVGPGASHQYPKLRVALAFASGTEVPGSVRTASNVTIERATITPMPAVKLAKYSVEEAAGTYGSNATVDGTGTAAKLNQVRGLCWLDNQNLLLTESNGSRVIRKFNKDTKAVTSAKALTTNAPWQGEMHGGIFYFTDKAANKVRTWNPTTDEVADVVSVSGGPMCVRFKGDDAYVVCRDASAVWKYEGGFSNAPVKFFDFAALDHGTDTNWPVALTFDTDGNAIVTVSSSKGTSTTAFKVYVIAPDGSVVSAIGKGVKGTSFAKLADGGVGEAVFSSSVSGIAQMPDGSLIMVDSWAVRRITKGSDGWKDAVVTTILGGGSSLRDGVGANIQLTNQPQDITIDPENSNILYFFDWKYTLRKITIE